MTKNLSIKFLTPLFGLLFLCICLVGLAKSLTLFEKSLQSDTAYHNLAAISTKTTAEFIGMVGSTAQPILEYAMRRVFFAPVFGDNERAIKLPSFICWVLILVIFPWLTLRAIQKEEPEQRLLSLIATSLLLLWVVSNPTLLEFSVEGRHYEWCALLSFLWFWAYQKVPSKFPFRFHVLSLIFMNSHFFVWPLVASAYLYATIDLILKGKRREALKVAGVGLLIALCSIVINWEGIHTLIVGDSYTGVVAPQKTTEGLWALILSKVELGRLFRSVFQIKYGFIGLALLGAIFFRKNYKFLFTLMVLVLTLWVIRTSSGFKFHPRYMLPFFGFAWWLLLELTLFVLDVLGSQLRLRSVFVLSALIAILIWFNRLHPIQALNVALRLGMPKKNFTDEFYQYETIKALDTPSIVIGRGHYPYMLTLWYLRDQPSNDPKVLSLAQDWIHATSWDVLWTEFKKKHPEARTFVHFYNPRLCEEANKNIFKEMKRLSEGCIGEALTKNSVETLRTLFSG